MWRFSYPNPFILIPILNICENWNDLYKTYIISQAAFLILYYIIFDQTTLTTFKLTDKSTFTNLTLWVEVNGLSQNKLKLVIFSA